MIDKTTSDKLDQLIKLNQQLLSVELYKLDVPQDQIARHLGIAKVSINSMLKSIKKVK